MILHIIGIILKIIGILLLVILGLLLVLIGILLFVPVRYELQADFPGKMEDIKGTLKVSWLLHLISGRATYKNGDFDLKGRIAWKKIGEAEAPEEKKSVPAEPVQRPAKPVAESARMEASEPEPFRQEQKKPEQKKTEPERLEPQTQKMEPEKRQVQEEAYPEPSKVEPEIKEASEPEETEEVEDTGAGEEKKQHRKRKKPVKAFGKMVRNISAKLRNLVQKIYRNLLGLVKKIKYTFQKLCGKIKTIAEKKDRILAFLEQENHKAAWEKGKKELVWIRRFLKPKKLRVKMEFGFEDPYHTGQMLAFLSVLYAFTGAYMEIEPNFEKRMLKGDLYIKGKLRVFPLLMFGLRMILDKNVRSTYHDIRAFEL